MTGRVNLADIKAEALARRGKQRFLVGLATCGVAAGATDIHTELTSLYGQSGRMGVAIGKTGCIGLCAYEPMMEVHREGHEPYFYVNLTAQRVREIVEHDLMGGNRLDKYVLGGEPLKSQLRIALRNCGVIDPDSLEEYIA